MDKVDRLSGLHESILHRIFSSIDTRLSVQTCILSKSWRNFWKSLPFLNFRGDDTCTPFKKFINKVLSLHECPNLKSFRLCCNFNMYTNRWILAALKRNVEEIYVHLSHDNLPFLPECLFVSNSLTILELKFLDTDDPFSIFKMPNVMNLPRLRTLVLENFWLLGADMSKIMSSCPVLETFSLIGGDFGIDDYCISSHSLKHLIIGNSIKFPTPVDGHNIKIYAPNLLSFYCRGTLSAYSLKNIVVLVKADIEIKQFEEDNNVGRMMTFQSVLRNFETLTLLSLSVEVISWCPRSVGSEPVQFCNLRHLKLQTCLSRKYFDSVPYFFKTFPKIESLHLEIEKEVKPSCSKSEVECPYQDKVREVAEVMSKCLHYHLKFVEIRRFEGHPNELVFLKILMKNAIVLEKLVLYVSAKAQSPHSRTCLMECISELLISTRTSSSVKIMLV